MQDSTAPSPMVAERVAKRFWFRIQGLESTDSDEVVIELFLKITAPNSISPSDISLEGAGAVLNNLQQDQVLSLEVTAVNIPEVQDPNPNPEE